MPEHAAVKRWRHPAVLIYLMGGFLGAAVNLGVTFSILRFFPNLFMPFIAFFLGTFLNQAFHYVYYHVVYVNQEIRMRTSLPIHLFMSFWVSAGSALLLWLFMQVLQWPLPESIATCLSILIVSNALLNRISTFSSAKMAEVEYREMDEDYYDGMTDEKKVSRFRAWYHRSRYERLTAHVTAYFNKGMKMADLGCGNCFWNIHHLPVFGLDINAKMLSFAKRQKRLTGFKVCSDLSKTGLKPKSLDIVLMSEVLEHVFNLTEVLSEVRRILKDNGTFLITVPYDFFMGPFFILFNLNCLYMGYVKGSLYHKYRCGHIHHYTKKRLAMTLKENGFELTQVYVVNGLLLYAAARKKVDPASGIEGGPRKKRAVK
jgi:ubiquinone/menaquinone biosynthesis C-methylase UbiE/putative flippase GtrA